MTDEQTFADYRSRLNIKDVLEDAGYTFYKRDGLRYPAYVRLGSDGQVHCHAQQELLFPAANHQALLCYLVHLGASRPFQGVQVWHEGISPCP